MTSDLSFRQADPGIEVSVKTGMAQSGPEEDQRAARRRPSDWALPGLGLGVGELRNNVKLLHHSERVPVGVLLDHLALF